MKFNHQILLVIFVLMSNCNLQAGKSKKDQKYLKTKCFSQRQQEAAEWVKDCDLIIEIGGGQNPICNYLNRKEVIEIDPSFKKWNKTKCVEYIPKNFQNWNWRNKDFKDKKIGVVLIGLMLDMPGGGWQNLYDLIQISEKTVIEWSASSKKAKKQQKNILENINNKNIKEKEFDFSNEFSNYRGAVYPFRKMSFLEKNNSKTLKSDDNRCAYFIDN